jgi:predicted phosphodiesterase
MATLVVSDLHLGTGTGAERLLCPEALAPLLEAIGECDRLVILGDLLELRQGPQWEALAVARPVLKEIAAALPAGGEIVIVPGNHDHRLLRGWFDRRGTTAPPGPLGTATEVEWHPDELLGAVVECLAPAPVRVSYPGVWLRDDVYATHGHYADRHTVVPMLERLGAGVNARVLREGAGAPGRAEDYEATLAPMYAWIDTIAQAQPVELGGARGGAQARARHRLADPRARRSVTGAALSGAFAAGIAGLNRAGLGPLRPHLAHEHLRQAALRAVGEVVTRLQVDAAYVISGHTHRAGPLPGDEDSEWLAPTGARMINIGCWVDEPGFVGDQPLTSPYRAGFCAWIRDGAAPELRCLLDPR